SRTIRFADRSNMASVSIAENFVFVGSLAFLAAAITGFMLRARILAVPNERSSHAHPVPSSGGVAIVITTCFGVAVAYFTSPNFDPVSRQLLGLGIASILIAGFGLLDDLGRLEGFRGKLAAQSLACALLVASGVVIESVAVPFFGEVVLGAWG